MSEIKSSRALALEAIGRVDQDQAYLDHSQDQAGADPRDRALFSELAYGVIRHKRLLDFFLDQFLERPGRTDPDTRNLLRLGAYQLLFLDRVPKHAAVNETVKLAPKHLKPLINAILRRLSERKDRLKSPDQTVDPVQRLGIKYSRPDWMVAYAIRELGEPEAEQLLEADNQRPRLTLRTNPLRSTRPDLLARLEQEGVPAEAGTFSELAVRIQEMKSPRLLPGFEQGCFAVQDEASQLAVMILDPKRGERILDACSAPGTKTLQLWQMMEQSGTLISADLNRNRLKQIHPEAERLGLTGFSTLIQDLTQPLKLSEAEAPFDKILLDAPCSGLGTIRKHPEIKWQRKPKDLLTLKDLQTRLIRNLARYLKPGGIMVYSTCTWTKEENQEVVAELIADGGFELDDPKPLLADSAKLLVNDKIMKTWPQRHSTDAFTAFRLRRK